MRKNTIDDFWKKVDKSGGPDSCWLWLRGRFTFGYGAFALHNKTIHAHRLAWELTNGQIPPGMMVCHNCPDGDNPLCCNPSHMFLGTDQDNMTDMCSKGRQAHPVGELHGMHKLTWGQVRDIRRRYKSGDKRVELMKEFGIQKSQLYRIVHDQTWRE